MDISFSLVGPGDVEFHYKELLGFSKENLDSELEKIAKVFSETDSVLELLPDKGVSFEIAKLYKKFGGKKVIASVPEDDTTFGVNHLQEYLDAKVNGKNLFDEKINSGDWFKQDLIKGLLGDVVLYLGASPGTNGELNYATYVYKLMRGMKKFIDVPSDKIHKRILAGKNIPYTYFIYTPFLKSGKLNFEDEKYLDKIGIKYVYINSAEELKQEIDNLKKL